MIKSVRIIFHQVKQKFESLQQHITGNQQIIQFIDASSPEGRREAVKCKISSVPTVLFFDGKMNEILRQGKEEYL